MNVAVSPLDGLTTIVSSSVSVALLFVASYVTPPDAIVYLNVRTALSAGDTVSAGLIVSVDAVPTRAVAALTVYKVLSPSIVKVSLAEGATSNPSTFSDVPVWLAPATKPPSSENTSPASGVVCIAASIRLVPLCPSPCTTGAP